MDKVMRQIYSSDNVTGASLMYFKEEVNLGVGLGHGRCHGRGFQLNVNPKKG